MKCERIDKEMAEKFYSVALCVLAAVLIRWCVSISPYSGTLWEKSDRIFTYFQLRLEVNARFFYRKRETTDVWRLRSAETLDGDNVQSAG